MKTRAARQRRSCGASLLEVLIAMLIFSFGMLGLAALQTYSVKANQGAHFRSQATALANTLLDNIRANRSNIGDYYSNAYVATTCGTAPTASAAAALDLQMWRQQVACQLPQGNAAVAPISATEVAVCIRWSDARMQEGATTGTDCVADSIKFKSGSAAGGSGAGSDGAASVFIVATYL